MKKLLLLLTASCIGFFNANAQVIYSTDFTVATGFTIIDGDGDTNNWGLFTGNATTNAWGLNGNFAGSRSYSTTAGALTPNNFLLSPVIVMPAATGTQVLTFKYGASDLADFDEKFSVYVVPSTATTQAQVLATPALFTRICDVTNARTATTVAIDVTAFATQSIKVVFRHYECTDNNIVYIDDLKIEQVSCAAPTAGTATVNITALTANLSWTSGGGAFDSEIVYQLAGGGVPAATDNTGTAVSGTSFAVADLDADTNYEFYVRDECVAGSSFSTWSGPFTFNTFTPPSCATLTTPINGATNVALTLVPSTQTPGTTQPRSDVFWTAPTSGNTPTGYNIYLGTTPTNLELLGNLAGTGASLTLLYNTTYYWKAVPRNAGGEATGCETFSFTTAPATSCLNNNYAQWPVAAYTPTVFDGITPNVVAADCFTSEYSSINVNTGQTYEFSSSVATDYVTVSTDNGATSVAFGLSPVTWTSTVTAPVRFYLHSDNTCAPQAVNRSRIVKAGPTLTNTSFDNAYFSAMPNPVKDILNLSYNKNITNVAVINFLGQTLLSVNNDSKLLNLDMSSLSTGNYLVKVTADNEVKTIKVIKE